MNQPCRDTPGALPRTGNLPKDNDTGVHALDAMILQASGAEALRGYIRCL